MRHLTGRLRHIIRGMMAPCLFTALFLSPVLGFAQSEAQTDVESRGLPGQLSPSPIGTVPPRLPAAVPISPGSLTLGALCIPIEVMTTKASVQIKCKIPLSAPTGVQFFAVGTEDQGFASRVMRLAAAAQIANSPVRIVFGATDTGGERFGCASSNCRLIQAVTLIDN